MFARLARLLRFASLSPIASSWSLPQRVRIFNHAQVGNIAVSGDTLAIIDRNNPTRELPRPSHCLPNLLFVILLSSCPAEVPSSPLYLISLPRFCFQQRPVSLFTFLSVRLLCLVRFACGCAEVLVLDLLSGKALAEPIKHEQEIVEIALNQTGARPVCCLYLSICFAWCVVGPALGLWLVLPARPCGEACLLSLVSSMAACNPFVAHAQSLRTDSLSLLSAAGLIADRKLTFIDRNRELYIAQVHRASSHKLLTVRASEDICFLLADLCLR